MTPPHGLLQKWRRRNLFWTYTRTTEKKYVRFFILFVDYKKDTYPTSNNWNIQQSTWKMDELKSIVTQMLALPK